MMDFNLAFNQFEFCFTVEVVDFNRELSAEINCITIGRFQNKSLRRIWYVHDRRSG